MKMICDRTLLSNAVAGVSKAVTQRSSIPVLEGILMKAEGFSLTLTGYDLETYWSRARSCFQPNCWATWCAACPAAKWR